MSDEYGKLVKFTLIGEQSHYFPKIHESQSKQSIKNRQSFVDYNEPKTKRGNTIVFGVIETPRT